MNHHAKTRRNRQELGTHKSVETNCMNRCSTVPIAKREKKKTKKKFSHKLIKFQCGRQELAHIDQPKLITWTTQLPKPMVPHRKKFFFLALHRPHIYDMDEYSRVSSFLHIATSKEFSPLFLCIQFITTTSQRRWKPGANLFSKAIATETSQEPISCEPTEQLFAGKRERREENKPAFYSLEPEESDCISMW